MYLSTAQAYANETFDEAVELLRTLARIPAPTGHEEQRAEFVASWLTDAGAKHVWIDEANNVLCWIGEGQAPYARGTEPGSGSADEAVPYARGTEPGSGSA
ncbi:MAG: hypothetical protein IKG21_12350, partial [Atopobiaceae bacterium]|nr:hypothetical protein [Atopobiaceae bacterium]